MNKGPLAIFDSGIGGLSLVRFLEQHSPSIDYLYFADTAFLPYGDKSPAQIIERVQTVVERLLSRGAQALAVACNTADAIAVSQLAGRWGVPVFRLIESASRCALERSRNRRIGVLATSLTAQSGAYSQALLQAGAQWAETVPCPRLVPLIEESPQSPEIRQCLKEYLAPLKAQGIDTLVLGCTHYSLIAPQIQSLLGPEVQLVDPAESTGRQVLEWLEGSEGRASRNFLVSGDPEVFWKRAFRSLSAPAPARPLNRTRRLGDPRTIWRRKGSLLGVDSGSHRLSPSPGAGLLWPQPVQVDQQRVLALPQHRQLSASQAGPE